MAFDRRVRLEFRGTQLSSDGGLLLIRELDEALGLSDLATSALTETRKGANCAHPVHLASGRAVSLGELALIANRAGGGRATVVDAPERPSSVARFVGDPSRAWDLLRWRAEIPIEAGVKQLVEAFAARRLPSSGTAREPGRGTGAGAAAPTTPAPAATPLWRPRPGGVPAGRTR